jgi:putative Holliday junction resolvase
MTSLARAVATAASPGTVLGFDFGEKRVGVAVGERLLGLAHPLSTIDFEDRERRLAAIDRLVAEWQPSQLVVGLPLAADGSEHEMTRRCRRFSRQLEARYRLPVELVDERYSSVSAEEALRAQGVDLRAGKHLIDAAAAQIILQGYFDAASRR